MDPEIYARDWDRYDFRMVDAEDSIILGKLTAGGLVHCSRPMRELHKQCINLGKGKACMIRADGSSVIVRFDEDGRVFTYNFTSCEWEFIGILVRGDN